MYGLIKTGKNPRMKEIKRDAQKVYPIELE